MFKGKPSYAEMKTFNNMAQDMKSANLSSKNINKRLGA